MKRLGRYAAILMMSVAGVAASSFELPLPDVPANLTVPAERADYILIHFWDKMQFEDTVQSLDTEFMSGNIANFLSVFPHAGDSARSEAIKILVERSVKYPAVAANIGEILEGYLLPKTSPMRDESLYEAFLSRMIASDYPNSVRNEWMYGMLSKNKPGTVVPDFEFEDRAGELKSFRESLGDKPAILIFYDPDCSDCSKVIKELEDDFLLRTRLESGAVKIYAIYADGDRDVWAESKKIPAGWIDGFDTGKIMEDDLFMLPAMPTLYFINPDKTIALKDCGVRQLLTKAYEFR